MAQTDPPTPNRSGKTIEPPVRNTRELMQGARELRIEHEGASYVLRITRFNKLILTK